MGNELSLECSENDFASASSFRAAAKSDFGKSLAVVRSDAGYRDAIYYDVYVTAMNAGAGVDDIDRVIKEAIQFVGDALIRLCDIAREVGVPDVSLATTLPHTVASGYGNVYAGVYVTTYKVGARAPTANTIASKAVRVYREVYLCSCVAAIRGGVPLNSATNLALTAATKAGNRCGTVYVDVSTAAYRTGAGALAAGRVADDAVSVYCDAYARLFETVMGTSVPAVHHANGTATATKRICEATDTFGHVADEAVHAYHEVMDLPAAAKRAKTSGGKTASRASMAPHTAGRFFVDICAAAIQTHSSLNDLVSLAFIAACTAGNHCDDVYDIVYAAVSETDTEAVTARSIAYGAIFIYRDVYVRFFSAILSTGTPAIDVADAANAADAALGAALATCHCYRETYLDLHNIGAGVTIESFRAVADVHARAYLASYRCTSDATLASSVARTAAHAARDAFIAARRLLKENVEAIVAAHVAVGPSFSQLCCILFEVDGLSADAVIIVAGYADSSQQFRLDDASMMNSSCGHCRLLWTNLVSR